MLGSSGGPKIITAVLHTVINTIDFQTSPLETVAAKRYHHQWMPDKLQIEPGVFSESLSTRLTGLGHSIKEGHTSSLIMLI